MPNVISNAEWISTVDSMPIPLTAIKRCVPVAKLLNKSNLNNSIGAKITIKQNTSGNYFRTIGKLTIANISSLALNEFAILEDLILGEFSGFESIEIYIIPPAASGNLSIILERSTNSCSEGGDGGDGLKIKLPPPH